MMDDTTSVTVSSDAVDAQAREAWIEERLALLTLDQKALLLAGRDAWRTPPIDEHGIPSIKVTDGPNGARGNGEGRATAACFPVGTALGATWDVNLLAEVGAALADEARSKGAQILLGPTVNLHRSPLGGRNFECYSEDPHLTARLAIGFIGGLQGAGVGACIKHFVANDSEFERMTISSEVDQRTLRELYLVPFEQAVAHARPWSVMAAYNRVNGAYACDNRELLIDVLKDEWGFDGLVISDWGAVHSTVEAANGGCDLEMPGPARYFGAELVDAVRAGAVDEAVLDDKVRRLLRSIWRSGRLEHPDDVAEQSIDQPEHRLLARQASTASMVLLKNDIVVEHEVPVLPLRPSGKLTTIAVIGPNAESGSYMGGGSSIVRAHYVVHPLEAIVERAGDHVEVRHEPAGHIERYQPPPVLEWFTPIDGDDGGRGWLVEYFDTPDLSGPVLSERRVKSVSWAWWRPPEGLTDPTVFSARWSATLVPPISGDWSFGLSAIGRSRATLDGAVIVDNWTAPVQGELFFSRGSTEVVETVHLEAGRAYGLHVEYLPAPDARPAAIRFGMTAPEATDPVDRAAELAAECDVAIVIVGTNGDWETEGSDRPHMHLPGRQDELIEAVAGANPNTVVVLNTGSPVEMPWIDDVPAVLQTWFGGQEYGHALADVLFGDAEPGGRLPTTFPQSYEDHPARDHYPGADGKVHYGEGVFMGYRGYEGEGTIPLFPFGHGLSYTTFTYVPEVELVVEDGVAFTTSIEVTNAGERHGYEVTQLFVHRSGIESVPRPPRELRGFEKRALAPGESVRVSFTLAARDFAYFDAERGAWVAEAGDYDLSICSSGVPVATTTVTLVDTIVI